MNDKVTTAIQLFQAAVDAARRNRVHRVLANQPLPRKKQPKFDRLLTQTIVARINAMNAYKAAWNKLTVFEKAEFSARVGDAS